MLDPKTSFLLPNPAASARPEATIPEQASLDQSVLTVKEFDVLPIPPRECLVGTWWRQGASGFLYAPRGLGKTWLAFYLAVCLADGRDCGPWKITKRRRVMYIDGEMPLDGLRERYRGLRQDQESDLLILSHERHFEKTGHALNLADPQVQRELTAICRERGIEVIFIDNLSCLFSGIRENEADDWERVQPWLLNLRRNGIAVCIVHHAGRDAGHMRGTTKREDACTWVLGLSKASSTDDKCEARFVSRFTKNREGQEIDANAKEWHFTTCDGRTTVATRNMDNIDVFVEHVREGLTSCTEIAEEMGVSKGTVSKLAKRAAEKGLIEISKSKYHAAGRSE